MISSCARAVEVAVTSGSPRAATVTIATRCPRGQPWFTARRRARWGVHVGGRGCSNRPMSGVCWILTALFLGWGGDDAMTPGVPDGGIDVKEGGGGPDAALPAPADAG